MKTGILLLLLLPCVATAQTIALLDRNFKKPIVTTQQLTAAQLAGKAFPIYESDLDSVIQLLETFVHTINTGVAQAAGMEVLPVGHSQLTINTERSGNANTYAIYLSTRAENLGASLEVVKKGVGNRRAVQDLLLLLDYLKNNRHIVQN